MDEKSYTSCKRLEPLRAILWSHALDSGTDAKEVVISYITALSGQDFKTARNHLNDTMSFKAPIASYNSADAYFKGNELLRSKHGIERVVYEIKKVFVDGKMMSALSLISA